MATVVHLAALSAVGAGYPAGIPVLAGGAPPAPPAPPFVAPPVPVMPPIPTVVPPEPTFPPVAVFPPAADVPPVPDAPPVPDWLQVSMHRAQMSVGTIRSVAQHAHVQTVSVHWPSTGIGTSSSDEQVHLSLPSVASHWAMAVYCTLHFVMALTVASAAFTQVFWQSVTGQAFVICACDAHIAVQACARVNPAPEPPAALPPVALPPAALPPAPTPPEPVRVPPDAVPVKPPEPEPPVPTVLPPLLGTPPEAPPVALTVEPPEPEPPVPTCLPPLLGTPPEAPPVALTVEPPEPEPPVPTCLPPLPVAPPRDVAPPLELPPVVLLLEQANANSIVAGSMRKTELVRCIEDSFAMKGRLSANLGQAK
jgi:hypothetical protein